MATALADELHRGSDIHQLFEPSPWRLLPPVTAFAALKLLIPSILKPPAARKWEEALRDAEPGEVDSGE